MMRSLFAVRSTCDEHSGCTGDSPDSSGKRDTERSFQWQVPAVTGLVLLSLVFNGWLVYVYVWSVTWFVLCVSINKQRQRRRVASAWRPSEHVHSGRGLQGVEVGHVIVLSFRSKLRRGHGAEQSGACLVCLFTPSGCSANAEKVFTERVLVSHLCLFCRFWCLCCLFVCCGVLGRFVFGESTPITHPSND